MSRNAVILLLFFILVTIFAEPLITKGLSFKSQDIDISREAQLKDSIIFSGDSLLANSYLPDIKSANTKACVFLVVKSCVSKVITPLLMRSIITAYSSSPDETKPENPYITASGSYVRSGVAASNFLPIGTRIRLPKLFPGKVFVIEDRMSKRYNDRVDIWMPNKVSALNFGLRVSDIEIF